MRDSLPRNLIDDAKHVITLLNAGHADSVQSRMTPAMQQQRTPAQRDSVWRAIVQQLGPLQRFGRARVQKGADGAPVVDMEIVFEHQPAEALVAYDVDGRIASISFQFERGSE